MEVENKKLTLLKVSRVTSNDKWPLIYLPKEAIQRLGLRKGRRILVLLNHHKGALIIKPIREGD
jgi:bifunctional DNA-binding transcriptional regulator/antitoxin component of YhaV-PrlF toxin-antitoxin module